MEKIDKQIHVTFGDTKEGGMQAVVDGSALIYKSDTSSYEELLSAIGRNMDEEASKNETKHDVVDGLKYGPYDSPVYFDKNIGLYVLEEKDGESIVVKVNM